MNASLTRDQVRDALLAILRDFLGEKGSAPISESTDPIKDLGLDSPDGVDFACVLSERFECRVPDDLNPFVDDVRHCGRRVGAIIDLVLRLIQNQRA
jgi:acyl carrier protein